MSDSLSAPGQAPEGGQPQAGTPSAPAATPAPGAQTPAFPANASQPTQPRYVFNSQEEIEAFADRLIDQRRRANRQAQEANSEVSALRQEVQQLLVQQRLAAQRAIAADVQLAAKNAGFRNPAFIYGAISNLLQYDQAGQPTNVQAVLDALKVSDPYLLEAQQQPQGQPLAQPGQLAPGQLPGQPAPQLPGQPQGSPAELPAQPQQRTGVMNAPQSSTTVGGELTWDVIQANIKNPAWVAQNQDKIEAFMANPLNHQQFRR